MHQALSRLRWQLTLSHLVAIACTLVSMIAAVVVIASSFIAAQGMGNPSREPAQDARAVAEAVSGLVARGATTDLNVVLRSLADGSLRVVAPFGPPNRGPASALGLTLRDGSYIVVLGPDGQ